MSGSAQAICREGRGALLPHEPRGYNTGLWPTSIWSGARIHEDEARYRQWLEETSGPGAAGECTPPMDVVETSGGIELVLDLPGVPALR